MPDYLNFRAQLSELKPEEAEQQLTIQLQRLHEALTRLEKSEKVCPDIFSRVVSV